MSHLSVEKIPALIALSHTLGAEHRELAILGEGNTSLRLDAETFLVKASGSSLGAMTEADVVECHFAPLLALLDREGVSDEQIDEELFGCRVNPEAKKPSVEALFHAYLLSLPGVGFVGHVHPVSVNGILCSSRSREFAEQRIFPDQIVCCGPASVLVPYADPGLKLSLAIRGGVAQYRERYGTLPRVILLENHGVITLGGTPQAVLAAMFMTDKAARIYLGATQLGGANYLAPEVTDRIANRADEHYRQRALQL